MSLTLEQSAEIRKSIGPLEETINAIYGSDYKPRELSGKEGIITRTFGKEKGKMYVFGGGTYFDSRRGKEVNTEMQEILDELKKYDKDPSEDNLVDLLMEVGDLIFQHEVVKAKHSGDPEYGDAIKLFELSLRYLSQELEARDIPSELECEFARVKYGARAYARLNGLPVKNKDLERELCRELI